MGKRGRERDGGNVYSSKRRWAGMASWAGMIGGLAVGLKDIEEEFQDSYLF